MIGMASPMLQEIFGGSLIGHPELALHFSSTPSSATLIAAIAAGFTGLLSLFNIGGRFFWASLSDYIGRKNTYYTFFLLGIALYATGALGGAYRQQGAVRRLLLRHPVDVWRRLRHRAGLSCRHVRHAVRGCHPRPLADRVVDRGHHRAGRRELHSRVRRSRPACRAITSTTSRCTSWPECWCSASICNMLVRPLADKWFMKPEEVAALQAQDGDRGRAGAERLVRHRQGRARCSRPPCSGPLSAIPMAWGVWITLKSALLIF